MRILFTFMCVLALAVIGCGKDVGDPCEVEGTNSCDPRHVLICRGGVWVEVGVACFPDQQCYSRDGEARCIDNECDTSNENFCLNLASSNCDGTVLRNCAAPRDCPMWVVEDCADSGLVCTFDTSKARALCVDGSGGTGGEVVECRTQSWYGVAILTCSYIPKPRGRP